MAQVERARSEADARFRSAFENAPIGIALVDFRDGADGRLTEVNRALCDLTGRSGEELIGSQADRPLHCGGRCQRRTATRAAARRRARAIHGREARASPRRQAGLARAERLDHPDENVARTAGIVQVQDVTERKRFEEQLRYVADHDSLTGLMNRRRFREELESSIALQRRYGGGGALLLIDLDRLKAVNDTRGHGAGDVALRRVAEAMRGRFRSTDVLARLAGDEFAVLLPNTEANEAMSLAQALIARLAADEVSSWGVSVSVGVAPFGEGLTGSAEDVMATADAAMYRAKQRGGAVAELADAPPQAPHTRTAERSDDPEQGSPSIAAVPTAHIAAVPTEHVVREPTIADRVRAAIEADELLIYGQPVVDLRSGRVAHHELLVRMRDESGTVLPASDFLGAAAQTEGVCTAIDDWVVTRAIAMLSNGSRGPASR